MAAGALKDVQEMKESLQQVGASAHFEPLTHLLRISPVSVCSWPL